MNVISVFAKGADNKGQYKRSEFSIGIFGALFRMVLFPMVVFLSYVHLCGAFFPLFGNTSILWIKLL